MNKNVMHYYVTEEGPEVGRRFGAQWADADTQDRERTADNMTEHATNTCRADIEADIVSRLNNSDAVDEYSDAEVSQIVDAAMLAAREEWRRS